MPRNPAPPVRRYVDAFLDCMSSELRRKDETVVISVLSLLRVQLASRNQGFALGGVPDRVSLGRIRVLAAGNQLRDRMRKLLANFREPGRTPTRLPLLNCSRKSVVIFALVDFNSRATLSLHHLP